MTNEYDPNCGCSVCVRSELDHLRALRALEIDHEPDGYPPVKMRDITALLDLNAKLLRLLAVMFDSYENGHQCYEDPEDQSGFLGHAFKLSDEDFKEIADALNALYQHAAIAKAEGSAS